MHNEVWCTALASACWSFLRYWLALHTDPYCMLAWVGAYVHHVAKLSIAWDKHTRDNGIISCFPGPGYGSSAQHEPDRVIAWQPIKTECGFAENQRGLHNPVYSRGGKHQWAQSLDEVYHYRWPHWQGVCYSSRSICGTIVNKTGARCSQNVERWRLPCRQDGIQYVTVL